MAKQTRSGQPSFYEVVFRGKPKVVRGFLHGLVMGAGADAQVFFSFTDGIAHEGKLERLAGKVGLHEADCHVVVDAGLAKLLKSLRKRIEQETGLEIASHRRVRSARLAFRFKAYTPHHDDEILDAVKKNVPAGVRLKEFEHDVKSDPSSRGVEAYAPAHHYESEGRGVLTGPVDALVAMHRRLEGYPLIEDDDIELSLA